MDTPTTILAAKFLSTTLALTAAGYGLNSSQNTVPRLYREPVRTGTAIFAHTFYTGATFAVPTSIGSILASSYLAYMLPEQRALWASAAGVILATMPLTRFVMFPGIFRLIAMSKDEKMCEESEGMREHVGLLKAWVGQNYLRASMFFAGGVVGMWAILTAS